MLSMVLQNPRIRKVSRMVGSDLKQLQELVGSSVPFTGALDLANFAKERHVTSNARCSLANLCAVILRKRLNKNVSERTSMAWERSALSAEQIRYAACDAYVSLSIYLALLKVSAPQPLPTDLISMTPVLLYHTDNTTMIACGHLSPNLGATSFDGINLTSTRTLIEVTDILVPAAIISTHYKRSLKSFGPIPFSLVCLRSHLRTFDPTTFHLSAPRQLQLVATTHANSGSFPALLEADKSADCDGEVDPATSDGAGQCLQELLGVLNDVEPEIVRNSEGSSSREIDIESQLYGQQMLQNANMTAWDTTVRSRVLKDPFHVFNMLRLSTTHSLRKEFARALRDILFVPDPEDRHRIMTWLAIAKPGVTFEQIQATNPVWLWKHCRRIIPPPDILSPLVNEFFLTFGPLKDAITKQPLFNSSNWQSARRIHEIIQQGLVSDPPGIPLYIQISVDKKAGGLPIYRCCRGTNSTEGGVHTHLRSHLPTSGASVRHANASLCDFILQHNLRVSTHSIL